MSTSADVVVIGAGAIGASCARALAIAGARVTMLDRPHSSGEGWRAAAGMLAAQVEAGPDDPLFNLALAGRAFYRRSACALQASTGIDIGLTQCGILQVAHSIGEAENLVERVAWQRQQGHRADWLEPDEVREGWKWLAPSMGGFWAAEDAAVDPARVVAAFRADAIRLGARLVEDTALSLERDGDRVTGVQGESDRYSTGTVVIAGGAWAGRLHNLPRPVSVEPVRGQMAAFPWPTGANEAIVYGQRCYVLKRGSEMLAGATMEHAGFEAEVTEEGLADLRRHLAPLYPALATAVPQRTWAGLRPGTPDGLPIIGGEPRLPGLWYATGHGRNGILLAGITGELIARGVMGEPLGDELFPVRATRFWNW